MKRARLRNWLTRRQQGQALVEMAFSMAILALLLLGVIEFGMLLYSYIVVVDAADEAVAYAALRPYDRDLDPECEYPCRLNNDPDIVQRVLDTTAGNSIVDPSNYVSISITPDYLHRDACEKVTVSTRYYHRFLTSFFGEGLALHYQAVHMVVSPGGMGICPSP